MSKTDRNQQALKWFEKEQIKDNLEIKSVKKTEYILGSLILLKGSQRRVPKRIYKLLITAS
jgi:hypothetical protein